MNCSRRINTLRQHILAEYNWLLNGHCAILSEKSKDSKPTLSGHSNRRPKQFFSDRILLVFYSALYLCIMSILLLNMYALISYATREWPEMYSFQ